MPDTESKPRVGEDVMHMMPVAEIGTSLSGSGPASTRSGG